MIPNCTKAQLKEFIDAKINGRSEAITREIEEEIHAKLDPFMDKVFATTPEVEKLAEKAKELYEKTIDQIGWSVMDWKYQSNTITDLNFIASINFKARSNLFMKVKNMVLEMDSTSKCSTELATIVNSLQTELRPTIDRLNKDFPQLRRELGSAITNAGSGKQAYKALVALGVDMSDFQPTNGNLPAVVKLSVDVCVLNGVC